MTVGQLLELGPTLLGKLGKKLTNKFWSQVLCTSSIVSENYLFCEPEMLMFSSFWHNPNILKGNKVIKYSDFPELRSKIRNVADFYQPGTNEFMDLESFNLRYGIELSELKFIDIRYLINLSIQKLNFNPKRLVPATRPIMPSLIQVALKIKKGCNIYYKILTKRQCLKSKIFLRDQKWHLELQSLYDISFWDKVRFLTSKFSLNNSIKWLQYRINRNSLQTNYITSHFIPGISPFCIFCGVAEEKISHLFWSCSVVNDFISKVLQYIQSLGLDINPSKRDFLFGNTEFSFEHPNNYLLLLMKQFIWKTKFQSAILDLKGLKNYLKDAIKELKIVYELKNKESLFSEWNNLYTNLCQEEDHNVQQATSRMSNLLLPPTSP